MLFTGTVVFIVWINSLKVTTVGCPDQAEITNVEFISSSAAIVTVHNSGKTNVNVVSATVNGSATVLGPSEKPANTILKDGSTNYVVILNGENKFDSGDQYQFRLITPYGTNLPYSITCTQ